jgi:hypothetical protein
LYYCHRLYTRPSNTRQRWCLSFLPGAVPRRHVCGTLWRGSGALPLLAGLFVDASMNNCLPNIHIPSESVVLALVLTTRTLT